MATETLLLTNEHKPSVAERAELLTKGREYENISPHTARNIIMRASRGRDDLDHSTLSDYLEEAYSFAQATSWDKVKDEPEPDKER